MSELLIFIFLTCGVTFIITQEYIFEGFRNLWCKCLWFSKHLQYLITCPVCLGFWVGLVFSFTPLFPNMEYWFAPFITSFICKLVLIWQGKNDFE